MATLPTNTASQPIESPGVPEWFARGRAGREAQTVANAVRRADRRPDGRSDSSWTERLRHSFAALVVGNYGLSLLLHLILLLTFAAVVFPHKGGHEFHTQAGFAESEGEELLDPRSFEIAAGSESPQEIETEITPVPIELPQPEPPVAYTEPVTDEGAEGTGEDAKDQAGSGADKRFAMPEGGNLVRQGSFAAWTIPADPGVGQDYAIVIEVTLPRGIERYPRNDLTGKLNGTDGYKILIPDGREHNGLGWAPPMRMPRFHRTDDVAHLVLFVRGSAEPLVRDEIVIHSRLLNETQELEIIF